MNKKELVAALAEATGKSDADARRFLDAFLGVMTQELQKKKPITLVGFGSFSVKARSARQGRDPRTGKPLTIPASNQPAFKAGKDLKQALN